jgi:hypothetical protein
MREHVGAGKPQRTASVAAPIYGRPRWHLNPLSARGTALTRSGAHIGKAFVLCAFLLLPHVPIVFAPATSKYRVEDRDSRAKFPRLVAEYPAIALSRHPALAAASGLHAGRTTEDYSALALSAESNALRAFQARLEKIPPLELRLSDTSLTTRFCPRT